MTYFQKSWENLKFAGSVGAGFDRKELGQFTFNLDFCVQHGYFTFNFALLGASFDAHFSAA